MPDHRLITGDCLDVLRSMPDDSVDLVFTSPPYEKARSYGELQFNLKGQEYVDWCVERYVECDRVCRGLVAWVIEGQTKDFRWSATPALLMADLHRRGIRLRKPPAFVRSGIAGSGGNDWLKNNYEMIVCSSKGRLPWSDNTACGSPPKYNPGGKMSHQTSDGRVARKEYKPPTIANPGNVLRFSVGGGLMGSEYAHCNEAPFPVSLAEFFVKSFCPPDGTVLDIFCGSGTTNHAALINGRNSIGIDIRGGVGGIETAQKRIESLLNG